MPITSIPAPLLAAVQSAISRKQGTVWGRLDLKIQGATVHLGSLELRPTASGIEAKLDGLPAAVAADGSFDTGTVRGRLFVKAQDGWPTAWLQIDAVKRSKQWRDVRGAVSDCGGGLVLPKTELRYFLGGTFTLDLRTRQVRTEEAAAAALGAELAASQASTPRSQPLSLPGDGWVGDGYGGLMLPKGDDNFVRCATIDPRRTRVSALVLGKVWIQR